MENEKQYVFRTRRGYLGYLKPQKTEIGTLRGITEFKTLEKAKIYKGDIEGCIGEILKDSKEFHEYINNRNKDLPEGEENLHLEIVMLDK